MFTGIVQKGKIHELTPSNTGWDIAINMPIFSKIARINDWLLFSSLGNDFNAIFTNECKTFYRQHNLNTIGKKIKIGMRYRLLRKPVCNQ